MTDQLTHGMIFLIQDFVHQTKAAMTYMNKFSICENDQFDILKIAYHGLRKHEVELSIDSSITEIGADALSFSRLEIFYFGVFNTNEGNKGNEGSTEIIGFEKLIWKILEKVKIDEKNKIRLSIVDFSPLKRTNPGYGKRIDKKKLHHIIVVESR